MLTDQDLLRTLLVALLAVPAAAAVVAALLGAGRGEVVRWVSLAATVVSLVLAVVVAAGFVNVRAEQGEPLADRSPTFSPDLVPGAAAGDPHRTTWNLVSVGSAGAVQFFIGLDGIN